MEKVRVLFYSNKPLGGIGGNAAFMFPKYVKSQNVDIKFICPEVKDRAVCESYIDEVELTGSAGFFSKLYSLFRRVLVFQPDLVHVFWFPWAFVLPLLFKLLFFWKKAPVWVVDIRSPEINVKSKVRFKEALKPIRQLGFSYIFCHQKSSAYSHLRCIYKPLHVVPPGFDALNEPDIHRKKSLGSTVRLVYIGSITSTRGVKKLIGILSNVKELSKSGFLVDFYGDGDFVNEFSDAVNRVGVADCVFYKGCVSTVDVPRVLQGYHAGISYIPTNMYMDAPPLKTIEYMANGLYVLGSDTTGNRMYVNDVEKGLLSSNDEQLFSSMIKNYVESPVYVEGIDASFSKHSWGSIVRTNLLVKYGEILS